MFSLTKFTKDVANRMSVADRTLLKIYLVILGLFLAKLFPILTSLHRGWYVGFLVISKLYFVQKIWGQKR